MRTLDSSSWFAPMRRASVSRLPWPAGTVTRLVEFIFMVIGKTTEMLSTYEAGESLRDVVGPLGVPTEMAEGPCAVIGGGVGLAIASRSPSTWSRPATRSTPSWRPHQGPPAHGGPVP